MKRRTGTMNRRRFLAHGLNAPLVAGAAWLLAGCNKQTQQGAACVDDAALTSSERSLRASLQYTDVTNDPSRRCDGCAFFKSDSASCGHCEMLSGIVSASGHCTSWSAKV